MVKLLYDCCCKRYISILSKHIFKITESCRLERTFTGHIVQSSWTAKQLEQVVHGLDVILPIKLTHWQFTHPSYFALHLDMQGGLKGKGSMKISMKKISENNFF